LPVNTDTRNRPLPDWEYIHNELRKKGMTLQLLWREYRIQYPDGVGYSMFCHHYGAYRKTINPIMRQRYKAGEKAFVDYSGMKIEWLHTDGEILTAEIFVGCLGASQLIYTEATATQQLPDWINSHINMFEFFGGVPEIIVPDNLRSAVNKAHRYDPDINANYQHFAEYYGVAIVPTRAGMPKDKAKVENAVAIVERQILAPLRNMTFTSIAEINAEIKPRNLALNKQQFQKMKTSRQQLFIEIDKPALRPLPIDRYQYATWKAAKVNIDYHFVFEDCFYSVPYKYVGKHVQIRATTKTVECFCAGIRIAVHPFNGKKYGFTTIAEHMPKAHQEQAKVSVAMLYNWAAKIGNNTVQFINSMIASRPFPQQAYRACLGLLRLSNKYGEIRLEKACGKALLAGANRYQQVEDILKNNLEEVPINDNNLLDIPLPKHENIRGANFYQ
jgi:transposase